MKHLISLVLSLALITLLCAGCSSSSESGSSGHHSTSATPDTLPISAPVTVDIYCVNDLHGKIADGDNHPGVDEMTTYFRDAMETKDHVILLSAGDMWQGSSESNMTHGHIITEWMNELGFACMTMGNHEYDWGEEIIETNEDLAQFPFLAINIYDVETGERVDYCEASTIVDLGEIEVGIIGAIGDCYSSIAADKVEDVYFMTGDDLTELVMAESDRLHQEGADFIVYVLHDGYGESKSASATQISSSQLSSYYDTDLSNGYVDLVFEGHTHQRYLLQDQYGVYHLQNKGDNKGITHVTFQVDPSTGESNVTAARLVTGSEYARLEDDPLISELLDKYEEEIAPALRVVGSNAELRKRNELRQLVADLYYEAAIQRWGASYDIVLGGGYISVRDPGQLAPGDVTYAMLHSLFPFDNQLVLCSIQGDDLLQRFFESDNSNYFICYGDYGAQVRQDIDPYATYYIVTDTYSSLYAPNHLTEIEYYDENVYARDLLADHIEQGGLS